MATRSPRNISARARGRRFLRRIVPSLQSDVRLLRMSELDLRTRLSITTKKYSHRLRRQLLFPIGRGPVVGGREFHVGNHMDAGHLQHVLVDTARTLRWMDTTRDASLTVIDVGAHNGETALAMCLLRPRSRVISFEPSPESYARAVHNVRTHPIEIHNVGLSDFSGEAAFEADAWDAKSRFSLNQRRTASTSQLLPVRTGDEIIDAASIDFLKIDVEGHESHVLRGLSRTLRRVDYVMVEWSLEGRDGDADLAAMAGALGHAGFELVRVGEIGWTEDGAQQVTADLYFRRMHR